MKNIIQQWFLVLLITLLFNNLYAVPPESETTVRGASSNAELTEMIFQAIKANNVESLLNYLPDENHLNILKRKSAKSDKFFFENLNAQSVKAVFEKNFENIMKTGIDNEINWSSLQLMEKNIKTNKILKSIHTTNLIMADNKDSKVSFTFDSIKISNKWFLIQGIQKDSVNEFGYVEKNK